jgi:16S rRNA C1402 (ribose-2'-O) methylase RsmI
MVPAAGWKAPTLLEDGFPAFSPKATVALRQLLDRRGTVMLTTSHRHRYTVAEWKAIFHRRGIRVSRLKKLNTTGRTRKDELVAWFSTNPVVEDFIIIDDDKSLHELPLHLKDRTIHTSPLVGLTEGQLLEHIPTA